MRVVIGAKRPSVSRLETRSQNSRNRDARCSGRLPAMMAALMAPIDVPATQLGMWPASHKAS
jgi:hypothetical protein